MPGLINPLAVRRLLIYRLGSMGDTVVAMPCLHLIAKAFPSAHRVLLTNFSVAAKAAQASAIIGDTGLVHDYMRYTVGERNPVALAKLWWQVVKFRADALVYLMPLRSKAAAARDSWFFRSAGITKIIGLPGENTSSHLHDEKTGLFESEASRLARCLSGMGNANPSDVKNWDLGLTETERKTSKDALRTLWDGPLIVCAPGTKNQSNDWEPENWCALVSKLSSDLPQYSLAVLGAKDDEAYGNRIAAAWSGKSVNLCGKTAPRVTAAVIERSNLFLGTDSGPMHLAAAVGTPVASPFSGRNKPGIWFPAGQSNQIIYHQIDCVGCGLNTCIERKKECLMSITVDEMYQASLQALGSEAEKERLRLKV